MVRSVRLLLFVSFTVFFAARAYAGPYCQRVLQMAAPELSQLVDRVFGQTPRSRKILLMVDLPPQFSGAGPKWIDRLGLAYHWGQLLRECRKQDSVSLVAYPAVAVDNAPLPEGGWDIPIFGHFHWTENELPRRDLVPLGDRLRGADVVLSMTEMSATAPLKLLGPELGFTAASMPGFYREMIPALRVSFAEVKKRGDEVAALLRSSEEARVRFEVNQGTSKEVFTMLFDLRNRAPRVSAGPLDALGDVSNLPAGQVYVAPYEGERLGEGSRTFGVIPVQFGEEIVLHKIVANRTVEITGRGPMARHLEKFISEEPAAGNIAELGFGILSGLGVQPIGAVHNDQLLGLYVAWGVSKHLGGVIGPEAFRNPRRAWHQDRVFIEASQPRVNVKEVELLQGEDWLPLMRDGKYLLSWQSP